MNREIGGEFQLKIPFLWSRPLNQFCQFTPNSARKFFTSSGRDSLKLIIKILGLNQSHEVLLPSYLCGEILRPFKDESINFTFYRINEDLTSDISDIKKRITKKTRVLLIIHYFGFPQPLEEIQKLSQEYSLCLIEDTTQSFLSKYNNQFLGWFGDIAFISFRKLLPILDGSALFINNKQISDGFAWNRYTLNWRLYIWFRYGGMILKYLYLGTHFIPKVLFLHLFGWADRILDRFPKPTKMSNFSQNLLKRFDFDEIVFRRRANFQYLLDNWHFDLARPLFKRLPTDICPFGFPVLVRDRDYVRRKLIGRRIYPPVHFKLPQEVGSDEFKISWEISRNILTIPIDQRYGFHDMDYILKEIEGISLR